MLKNLHFLACLIIISLQPIHAQTSTDLWVMDTEGKGGKIKLLIHTAKALTNRPEYDNQPNFINDSELVFSGADQKGNHDIILYSFRTGKFTNFSKTADRSEFSPNLTDCGQYISAVVVEPDGTQRLWLYPIIGEAPELLYDDIAPVGYYDWFENKAAMFVLGDPNKLVYARGKGNSQELAKNIGRSVKRRPNSAEITFLDRNEILKDEKGDRIAIKSFNFKAKRYQSLGFTLTGSQDLIWLDKNHLLMAQGNEFFIKDVGNQDWVFLGKIETSTHQNISRLAYNSELNKLVFVMNRN